MLPDPQLVFGRVVEDVEGDLVADAAAAEEVVGGDLGKILLSRSVKGHSWRHLNAAQDVLFVMAFR